MVPIKIVRTFLLILIFTIFITYFLLSYTHVSRNDINREKIIFTVPQPYEKIVEQEPKTTSFSLVDTTIIITEKSNDEIVEDDDYFTVKKYNFSLKTDLLVFLHIEKTGGTEFEMKLTFNLTVYDSGNKTWVNACLYKPSVLIKNQTQVYAKYYCPRGTGSIRPNPYAISNSWLFTRQTYGWGLHWGCNVHADYGKFKKCMDKVKKETHILQNVHFITILRDPVIRYVSEWQHLTRRIQEGLKGKLFESYNICNKETSISTCYKSSESASLENFMACKSNGAENRETRHLADYDQSLQNNCSLFQKQNGQLLLENAKKVLEGMSFFALTEYEELSQLLFEKTFQNVFRFNYTITPDKYKIVTLNFVQSLDKSVIDKLNELNSLDIELYAFAKKLFFKRLKYFKINF